MFRQNQRHRQMTMFGTAHQLPVGVKKMMDKSCDPAFRRLIFEKINERRYREIEKARDGIEHFKKVKMQWEERRDTWK